MAGRFFHLSNEMKIGGKQYVPCVSYPVTPELEPTVDKLVADGKAYATKERAVFENGTVKVAKAEAKATSKKGTVEL